MSFGGGLCSSFQYQYIFGLAFEDKNHMYSNSQTRWGRTNRTVFVAIRTYPNLKPNQTAFYRRALAECFVLLAPRTSDVGLPSSPQGKGILLSRKRRVFVATMPCQVLPTNNFFNLFKMFVLNFPASC